MAITVKFYKSTDSGAPTLSGSAGALIGVLDAVLSNGYNSKTITITRSGTTATATATAHGFVAGQHILVAGASQSDYNGEFYIASVPTADTFTYTVANSPATPATGTITAKIAPVGGWTKAFSGTNLAAYRADAGNRLYLRIDDTGTTTARVVGYESMSDVNTGTDAFPTAGQFAGGLYVAKSSIADASSRKWAILATPKNFYFAINYTPDATNAELHDLWVFGEFNSYVTSDAYKTLMIARNSSSLSSSTYVWAPCIGTTANTSTGGHYIARGYNSTSKSVTCNKQLSPWSCAWGSTPGIYGTSVRYPSWPDRKLWFSGYALNEVATTGVQRGVLPGLWYTLQNVNTNEWRNYDIYEPGPGTSLAGKKFMMVRTAGGSATWFEISDTWSITT